MDLVESVTQFILFSFFLQLNGRSDRCGREFNGSQLNIMTFFMKSIIHFTVFQFYHSSNITRSDLSYLYPFMALGQKQTSQPYSTLIRTVHHIHSRLDASTIYLKVYQIT